MCKVEECNNKILAKGYCQKHYNQIWRNGKLKDKEIITDLEGEKWKEINGYEGLYQVSNLGRIKSLTKTVTCGKGTTIIEEKILKFRNCDGYNRVHLMKDKKETNIYVHRLVAQAFIPNNNNYPIVNHKDEDKTNNKVENLEWCTYKYNVNYGTANKRRGEKFKGHEVKKETRNKISKALMGIKRENISGGRNHLARKVVCITTGEKFDCIIDAERKYKINNISSCCRRIQKYAGKVNGDKMVWEYYKEGNVNG